MRKPAKASWCLNPGTYSKLNAFPDCLHNPLCAFAPYTWLNLTVHPFRFPVSVSRYTSHHSAEYKLIMANWVRETSNQSALKENNDNKGLIPICVIRVIGAVKRKVHN